MIKVRKTNAVLMILLIVLLPVYSAQVFAASITINSITGSEGVDWIRKSDDTTALDVTIFDDGLPVEASDVTYERPYKASTAFSQCTDGGGGYYTCTATETDTLPGGKLTYTVVFGSESRGAQILIDDFAPYTNALNIYSDYVNATPTINFEVSDIPSSGSSDLCSGFKAVKVFERSTRQELSTNTLEISACSYDGGASVDLSTLSAGEHVICLLAVDRAGNFDSAWLATNTICKEVNIDNTKPQVSSVALTSNGEQVHYLAPAGKFVYLNISVTTDTAPISATESWADLSNIAGNDALDKVPPLCEILEETNTSTTYNCYWYFRAKIADSGSISVPYNIVDEAGNFNTNTKSFSLSLDVNPPTITEVVTNHVYDSVSYVGYNNTFIVRLSDGASGSGFSEEQVFLNNLIADECSGQSGDWNCYWYNIIPPTSTGSNLALQVEAFDDTGQQNTFSTTLPTDFTPPVVNNITLHNDDAIILEDETIIFKVRLYDAQSGIKSDDGSYNAYANFENINGESMVQASQCYNENDNFWLCEFQATRVWAGPVSASFTIYDTAENKEEVATNSQFYYNGGGAYINNEFNSYRVYRSDTATVARDYWTIEVLDHTPRAVDREITDFLSVPVTFTLELKGSSSGIKPLLLEFRGCEGTQNSQYYDAYTKDGHENLIMNGFAPAGPSPYTFDFQFFLVDDTMPDEASLNFTCEFSTITQRGTMATNAELDLVNISVPLYNYPLGELSQNVENKIDNIKDSWIVSAEWIGSLQEILDYGQRICSMIKIYHKLAVLIAWIKDGLKGCPMCKPAEKAAGGMVFAIEDLAGSVWKKYANYMCAALECRLWNEIIAHNEDGDSGKFTNFFGDIEEWVDDPLALKKACGEPGTDAYTECVKNLGDVGFDTKESLIWSTLTLCVPGVVYNLQKARVLECNKISCYQQTADQTYTVDECEKQYSYGMCKYVYGQIFNLIPLSKLTSNFVKAVGNVLKDPVALTTFAIKWVCAVSTCGGEKGSCGACTVVSQVDWLASLACDLGAGDCPGLWDDSDTTVDDSICEEVLDEDDE
ncbi:hypothetical protein GOV04_00600 [Candidatus Woesearchaeota archaeon]|nr:hypothetical protein [Candidatus Woesearchaeota archaeon]